MLITCPDCAVRYDVVDTDLVPGRRARCVRCGCLWTPIAAVTPPAPAPQPAPPPAAAAPVALEPAQAPPPSAPPRPILPLPHETRVFPPIPLPEPPRRRNPLRVASLLGLVAIVAFAFVAFRAEAEAAWPPITRLYGALGLG